MVWLLFSLWSGSSVACGLWLLCGLWSGLCVAYGLVCDFLSDFSAAYGLARVAYDLVPFWLMIWPLCGLWSVLSLVYDIHIIINKNLTNLLL